MHEENIIAKKFMQKHMGQQNELMDIIQVLKNKLMEIHNDQLFDSKMNIAKNIMQKLCDMHMNQVDMFEQAFNQLDAYKGLVHKSEINLLHLIMLKL